MNNFEILQSMNTQQSAISKKFDFLASYLIAIGADIAALGCDRTLEHITHYAEGLKLLGELFILESRHLIQNQASATSMEDILNKAKMDQLNKDNENKDKKDD